MNDRAVMGGTPFHPGLFDAPGGVPQLIASRCRSCGRHAFPPKRFCSFCHGGDCEIVHLKGLGRIYSFTRVALPPKSMGRPYIAAYVDMDEGVRIFAQITDAGPAQLRIGDRVQVAFGQALGLAPGTVAYTFVPTREEVA